MEIDDINGEDYTIIDLRKWLRHLGLPMSGNKSALVLRLNSVPVDQRGECPADDSDHSETELDTDGTVNVNAQNINPEAESVNNAAKNLTPDAVHENREFELCKREREILSRENELLKRELELQKKYKTSPIEPQTDQSIPLNLIKELIADFDENTNFDFWEKQVRSVATTYRLNDDLLRAIIVSKLKGKALNWLHSNTNCATLSVDHLLTLMNNTFCSKESKLALRQKFEARKWNAEESFTDFFNDKILLANMLQLDEQELIDYIIDGIPNEQIRMQAFIQCFKTKQDLLQAFSKIQLKPRRKLEKNQQQAANVDKQNTRCYNCNSLGHWKDECRKPKREAGTCYGCGSKEHNVRSCPNRKSTISYVEHNYKP